MIVIKYFFNKINLINIFIKKIRDGIRLSLSLEEASNGEVVRIKKNNS